VTLPFGESERLRPFIDDSKLQYIEIRGVSVPADIYGPLAVPERGHQSPYAFGEYLPEGSTHTHMVPTGGILGIEEAATLLSESVFACNEQRHVDAKGKSHGQEHPVGAPEEAFKAAVAQLQDGQFDNEYNDLNRKIARFKRWGGNAPAAIFMPTGDDLKRWSMLTEIADGQIMEYDIDPTAFEDMGQDQEVGKNLIKNPEGPGYLTSGPKGGKKWTLGNHLDRRGLTD
jgi:hypothetical protein